ncbi:hypothetical protein PFISCL1PPCAC_28552 [Pristionchus fissidentatus]|uniref:Uncharacterized protein n=1 Tax=Pristionchus fissidentatus TaxID=1538716 RepID=A0AAV5X2R1_9BILA|nr:hypothetical protein PFISCL1PPCAC_28552 [Pristionchus fissidentatus]
MRVDRVREEGDQKSEINGLGLDGRTVGRETRHLGGELLVQLPALLQCLRRLDVLLNGIGGLAEHAHRELVAQLFQHRMLREHLSLATRHDARAQIDDHARVGHGGILLLETRDVVQITRLAHPKTAHDRPSQTR